MSFWRSLASSICYNDMISAFPQHQQYNNALFTYVSQYVEIIKNVQSNNTLGTIINVNSGDKRGEKGKSQTGGVTIFMSGPFHVSYYCMEEISQIAFFWRKYWTNYAILVQSALIHKYILIFHFGIAMKMPLLDTLCSKIL